MGNEGCLSDTNRRPLRLRLRAEAYRAPQALGDDGVLGAGLPTILDPVRPVVGHPAGGL